MAKVILSPELRVFNFRKKVGDLGVALAGRRVGSFEDDVALFEDVADVPIG